MRVLAIGECMAELAPSRQAGEFSLGYAGDAFNTAWYLARVAPALEVQFLTAVGVDRLSDQMVSFMEQSRIDTTHVARHSEKTIGLYMIHLEKGERSFSYWRSQSAARQFASDVPALNRSMTSADLIYFSGISLAILDRHSRTLFLDAVREHRASGKTIAFDTNLRRQLWGSAEDMMETTMAAAKCADIVLPSFDDEAAWFGDRSPTDTLERYAKEGVPQIVVKNGDGTIEFQDGNQRDVAEVQPVSNVIDATAAGDSFNAGVLAVLLQGKSLRAGIEFGCCIARQVVEGKGALVPVNVPSNEHAYAEG